MPQGSFAGFCDASRRKIQQKNPGEEQCEGKERGLCEAPCLSFIPIDRNNFSTYNRMVQSIKEIGGYACAEERALPDAEEVSWRLF